MIRCSRTPSASLLATVLAIAAVGMPTLARGKPTFASPNANPIARSPVLDELYVVNTPGDTLDVVDTSAGAVTARIPVGIDPVSVAVRPDGKEVWVSNHVSDTVSVVDVDPASPTRHQVVATVTAWSEDGWVTDFDEPVGIAFASNAKAYVALSSRNRIAVVDVATRTVTKQVQVLAQEPRAITVRGNRLYVIPFESGNTTELSGCLTMTDPGCTFSLIELVSNSIDVILTRNMVADIVRRPGTPDRDLFVYDTADESTLFEVSGLGTLLYGLAVDSTGHVFVALTEARNDSNGHMGTAGADLIDMENRAFLNQIARVDCSSGCSDVTHIDLEPVPPADPAPGRQLATPFGIQVSGDDSTIIAVAAASSRLFTMDAATGAVLGRVDVGAIPRGLVLESDAGGAPSVAWVLNALEDSVSRVDVSDPANPHETARIPLADPTLPDVKRGQIRFNDANGSTTGTFACASCHPDGHTDQLLWNLGARCLTPGCDQTQPRVTMPIRGLRDTLPLHWDGTVGDPFGGINAAVADSGVMVPPTCTDEDSCFRDLVNGSMATTMCNQAACPSDENELGLPGAFDEADRDAIAVFLRAVPYPPARSRRLDDHFSPLAAEGFRNFLIGVDSAHPGCSRARACHALPFWNGTNTSDTGFDAPTFRGLTDRTLLLPNGRAGMWQLLSASVLNPVAWNPLDGPDELYSWGMTFGTEAVPLTNREGSGTGPFSFFQLFEEGSTGFPAAFARQVTLDRQSTRGDAEAGTRELLDRLQRADANGVVDLHATGRRLRDGSAIELAYDGGTYVPTTGTGPSQSSDSLVADARRGELIVTVTARLGARADVEHPQPALWLFPRNASNPEGRARIPELTDEPTLTLFGRHIAENPIVLVDGRAVPATVTCELGGVLPDCAGEQLHIELPYMPRAGDRTLQIGTPGGLVSNEVLVISAGCPGEPTFGALTCRLASLRETIEVASDLGTFERRLERRLVAAEEAVTEAQLQLDAGANTVAASRLRRAESQLRNLVRRVDSRRGRTVIGDATRIQLLDDGGAAQALAVALRDSL
ncbi:MAG TPA: YncE family protein [Candidatus Binatia bacterium]|jgi:YVTN family beta-propeller protein|nr:YncE family protein [Candidatus Binatia bacterium]